METGIDACQCNLISNGIQVGRFMHRSRRRRGGDRHLWMSLEPITFWITVVTAPLRMQWAHGYSGCSGVLSSGSQVASRSVLSLPSMSPLRIAVIGRQNI